MITKPQQLPDNLKVEARFWAKDIRLRPNGGRTCRKCRVSNLASYHAKRKNRLLPGRDFVHKCKYCGRQYFYHGAYKKHLLGEHGLPQEVT